MSAMVLITFAITAEEHGLATNNPFTIIVVIGAVCQVERFFFARGVKQSDVSMMIATITDIAGKEPFAIRTPLEVDVTITIREDELAIHHRTYLFAGKVDDADGATILKIGYLFAIGTVLWLERGLVLIR